MRLPPVLLALLMLSAFAAALAAPQVQAVDLTANVAPALVEVTGGLNFPNFVPDVVNSANITVGLALSNLDVLTIQASNLTVYVLVQPKRNDSLLYFGGIPQAKSYYLTLTCDIVNGTCAPDSKVQQNISVYFQSSTELPLRDDGIILQASVTPLISEQLNMSGIAINQSAYDQVGNLQAEITQAASGLFGLVGQAANATGGAIHALSTTVTINSTTANVTAESSNITDPLLQQAAQDAAQARADILAGDYSDASSLTNQSEAYLAEYQAKQQSKPIDLSPMVGLVLGSASNPWVALAVILVLCVGLFAWKHRDDFGKGKRGKSSGYLNFDGL